MLFKTKNSKKIIAWIAVFVFVSNLFFFGATSTHAAGLCTFFPASPFCAGAIAGIPINGGPATEPGPSAASGPFGVVIAIAVWVFGAIGNVIMELAALFLRLAGVVYDKAISVNLDFNQYVDLVKIGWTISRDVANMFFILILLFIAITTMLRVSGYETKVLLRKLIVIGLLINFSLAGGLVIIDGTNVLGNEFYRGALGCSVGQPCTNNLSSKIMEGARLPALYVFKAPTATLTQTGGNIVDQVFGGTGLVDQATNFAKITWGAVILISIFAYILLFASILLIIRFAVLVILLVLMPLAFLGIILPKTEGMWNEWWHSFINHAFFFPAHMFMIMFVTTFTNRFLIKFVGPAPASLGQNLLDPAPGAQPLFLGYIIACVMLVGSLIVAKKMSVYGANSVVGWAKRGGQMFQGAMLNQTIGRIGQKLVEKNPTSYTAQRVGSTMMGMGKKSPFGSREEQINKKADFELKALKNQSPQAQIAALMESKNAKKSQALAQNIIGDDKALAAIVKKGDVAELAELRRLLQVQKDDKGIKKLEKAVARGDITKAQAGTATTPAKTTAQFMNDIETDMRRAGKTDAEISAEQEKYWKVMTSQEQADTAANFHGDTAKVNRMHGWTNNMDPEDKIKANEIIGKALARDIDKLSTSFDTLPEDFQKSAGENLSDREAQQIADKAPDKDAFYNFITKHAPNRKEAVNVVLPDVALRNGGDASKIVPALNTRAVPAGQMTPQVLQNVMEHGSAQQIRELAARADVLPALKTQLTPLYAKAGGDIDKFAKAMETQNRALASWIISHQNEAKTLFDLT